MITLKKTAAAAGIAAMMLLGACATNDATVAETTDYTNVDQAVTTGSSEGTATTPAVIPGPAKVDSDGNLYTSSAAPGTGNASAIGTNTNVSIIPEKAQVVSETSVTYIPTEEPVAVVETTTITEVTEPPMVSAVEEEIVTTVTHERVSKD